MVVLNFIKMVHSMLQLRLKVRNLLPTLDLETTTQKTIQELVEEDMGVNCLDDSQKAVIREEIDMFLHEKCMNQGPDDGPGNTKKRKMEESSSGPRPAAGVETKKANTGEMVESTDVPGFYAISAKRFVGVTSYAGKILVNIREYYEKDGQMMPGSKGISLTTTQWEQLNKVVDGGKVSEALKDPGSESTMFDLSSTRKIGVRLFGSRVLVDIREYYDKDGQSLPGKKGISLLQDQWERFVEVMPYIQGKLEERGYSGATEQEQPVPSVHQGIGDSNPGQREEHGDAPTKYSISTDRFVTLENWKGTDTIDIREYYQANGEQRPGKKGITLSLPQVRVLEAQLDAVSEALSKQDESFSLQLSAKRQVTVSVFKGVAMVNIREYYEKDGALLPTKKGISLPSDQWSSCKTALAKLAKIANP